MGIVICLGMSCNISKGKRQSNNVYLVPNNMSGDSENVDRLVLTT